MSGIFGILNRSGAPLPLSTLEGMARSLAPWEGHTVHIWQGATVGLGVATLRSTPESGNQCLPRSNPASGIAFAASGRIDNRADLAGRLDLSPGELAKLSDGELMLQAYLQWGTQVTHHFLGDWALAAWDPSTQTLFLARDRFGTTSLFYHADAHHFVFAPTRQVLLNLNLFAVELDELYLAQVLVAWPAYHGERTIHRPIRRLPPAHTLTVTPETLAVQQYWRMEDVSDLRWSKRRDYVDAFTEIFDEAVRARVRAPDDASGIGVTLSGGLDSSSVTATAAMILQEQNRRVAAFVSVPLTDASAFTGNRFGDEYPFAAATARFAGNVDLHPVLARTMSPVGGVRRQLEILNEPSHGAGNAYWILEIERMARAERVRVLLTGQQGNGGVSWRGDLLSQPISAQFRLMSVAEWVKAQCAAIKEKFWYTEFFKKSRYRQEQRAQWHRRSAIRLDFAERMDILEQRLSDPLDMPPRNARENRYRILQPARSTVGAIYAELGAAYGLEIRDPTADVRVIQFALSVPDEIFIDPDNGTNRWLIREAMKGRLPEEVRLNRRRGRQAADIVPRLRASAGEVEDALAELEDGHSATYLDVAYMREVWEQVKAKDSPDARRKAATVLLRGIGTGLFVNQFSSRPAQRSRAAAAYSSIQIEAL